MRGQQPCPPPSISGASSTFTAASPTRPTGRGPPIADWRLRSISRASRSTSSPQPSYSPLPAATTAIPRPPLSLPSTRSTTTCLLSTSSAPIRPPPTPPPTPALLSPSSPPTRPPPATASTSAASLPLTRQTSPRRSTIKYLDRSTIKYRDRSQQCRINVAPIAPHVAADEALRIFLRFDKREERAGSENEPAHGKAR